MRKRRERERNKREGREKGGERRERVERQWDPLSVGVNSSTELVGASKRNHFPKIHLFPFFNFLGPYFYFLFPW